MKCAFELKWGVFSVPSFDFSDILGFDFIIIGKNYW